MTKKLILGVASCALLLAGCSTNETFENLSEGRPIGFETLNDRLTKAANEQDAHYGIFAKATTGNPTEFYKFNNREVTPGANGDTYSPKELWPSYALDFYGYAPYTETSPITFDNGAFSFIVPDNAQTDLTFAKAINQTTGSVALEFNHMLSKIQLGTVTLAQNLIDAGYTLDGTDANRIQIYVTDNAGTNNLYTPGDWSVTEGAGFMYSNAKFYYIMPQAITTNTEVKVQLYGLKIMKGTAVYKDNVAVKFAWVPQTAIKNTKTAATDDDGIFLLGTRYTINFTLGSDATKPDITDPTDPEKPGEPIFDNYIGFSSSVANWVDEVMGNIDLNN